MTEEAIKPVEAPVVTLETVMKDEVIGKQLKSFVDSEIGKAVESYKKQGFQTAVEKATEERLKAMQTKTPEQIRFDEYEAKLAEMNNRLKEKDIFEMRNKNKETARSLFKEKNLPEGLLDFLVDPDEVKTKANLETAIKELEAFSTSLKQTVLKGNNIQVPSASASSGTGTKPPGEGATKEEWKAWYQSQDVK